MVDFPTTGIGALLGSIIGFFLNHISGTPKLENKTGQIEIKYKEKVMKYDLNIWTLHFENKAYWAVSRDANSFYIGVNIIKDKEKLNNSEFILIPKNNNLVIPYQIDATDTGYGIEESDYPKILAERIKSYLKPEIRPYMNLIIGTKEVFIFLISIKDLNYIYLIDEEDSYYKSEKAYGIEMTNYDLKSNWLPFDKYILHMVFHIGKREDSKVTKFKLNIKDWNNIEIKKKRF